MLTTPKGKAMFDQVNRAPCMTCMLIAGLLTSHSDQLAHSQDAELVN